MAFLGLYALQHRGQEACGIASFDGQRFHYEKHMGHVGDAFAGADLITPNRSELAAATGMPTGTEAEIIAAATVLRDRHRFAAVLVTRGSDGMTLLTGSHIYHFPAEAAVVVDLSGVGDTVIATLAAGLACGLDLPVAVRLSNIAAGIVVGKPGIMTATQDELVNELVPGHTVAAGR